MINYNKNELINKTLDKYYETFSHTLDTADYVPEKFNEKISKYIFKNMKRSFRQIDKEDRKYQKALKQIEYEKIEKQKKKYKLLKNKKKKENKKQKDLHNKKRPKKKAKKHNHKPFSFRSLINKLLRRKNVKEKAESGTKCHE